MAKAGRGSDQFPLRLPPGMREQIKQAAEASGRSMNEEILDVLREYFPQQPGMEEILDEIAYTAQILEALRVEEPSDGLTSSDKIQIVLGRLEEANDKLRKFFGEKQPSVVKLDKEIHSNVEQLMKEWDISFEGSLDGVINGLVQMSVDRVSRREESIRIAVGEGDARRIVELIPPWETSPRSGE